MNNRKITTALTELNMYENFKDYLKSNNLITRIMSKDYFDTNDDAMIMGNTIYLRWGLSKEYKQFLILHEIGHHLMHCKSSYSFNINIAKNKCEIEANTFACTYLLNDIDLSDINILQHLMGRGVPEQVAINYYERMRGR